MTSYRALSKLLFACLAFTISPSARSNPILGPFWILDTPTEAVVRFSHREILPGTTQHDLGPFVSPGGFWTINSLNITEVGAPADFDSVLITGAFQHLIGPHPPEGPGQVFNFRFLFDASGGGGARTITQELDHPNLGHIDAFQATVAWTTNPARRLVKDYGLVVAATHVIPEPSTSILLSTGALCILAHWRRKHSSLYAKLMTKDESEVNAKEAPHY